MLASTAVAASVRALGRFGGAGTLVDVPVVDFRNAAGERIRAIVDRSAPASTGGVGVVIAPAWGRTKETLLPLAASIVEVFRGAREPVTVLRFDGTRRRGESHKEAGFSDAGSEHIPFRLRHAVDDIHAAVDYLRTAPDIKASKVILITFSAASIEGRRAVLTSPLIDGWVCVVGAPDLQSGLRNVSGGIDYVAGVDRGFEYGIQEIMGVATDISGLISEAIEARLAFLEDARRDMAGVTVPVTWIHGANDAWLDLGRVRAVMGAGELTNRRLIEVPTGHQLRSSREALEVFQLVAQQVAQMAVGQSVSPRLPSLASLERRRVAERKRLPRVANDLREFWRVYLLGRGRALGIEMMNATRAYRELMALQVSALRVESGSRIADIGSGTGSFPLALAEMHADLHDLVVSEFDFVAEALDRARVKTLGKLPADWKLELIECDVEKPEERERVLGASRFDSALMSLVLSYVKDPMGLLQSVYRALRPNGRLVLSNLKRDADISRLYLAGIHELRTGRAREAFGEDAEKLLSESAVSFLNDAARVLDFEEQGVFSFLDADEVRDLVARAGFRVRSVISAFGDPAQAVVVTAEKAT
jgi:ubiquinone/menaquinone biosynthesis C-methylase UbiE/pimeloyl-ACP methyl ester carboxylesterase